MEKLTINETTEIDIITSGITITKDYDVSNSIFVQCQNSRGGAIFIEVDANVNLSFLFFSECYAITGIAQGGGVLLSRACSSLSSLCFSMCQSDFGPDYSMFNMKEGKIQFLQSFRNSFSHHSSYVGCDGLTTASNVNISDSENYKSVTRQGYGCGLTTWMKTESIFCYYSIFRCKTGYGIICRKPSTSRKKV